MVSFIDEVQIQVNSGKGGNGSAGFRREKYIPRGGPDGGDGGHGGDVVLLATARMNTLMFFQHKKQFVAQSGAPGKGKQCTGKSGETLVIEVPCGTVIYDADTEELIVDMCKPEQRFVIAKGGGGGLGNIHFKSSVNQAPTRFTPGKPGETRLLRMELRVLADVGLVGMPNAGKSTLIRSLSDATPKVADYPFTTLRPYLGVVRINSWQQFVMADIPGLIKGASEGSGLGHQFLRHVFRCKLLLHIVDASNDIDAVIDAIDVIHTELINYSKLLEQKICWLVLNKCDLIDSDKQHELLLRVKKFENFPYITCISGATRMGIDVLCKQVACHMDSEHEVSLL
jgi:GTPase